MKRLLIVVDFQKDFVDGALGFPGALPLREREVVLLRYYQEMRLQEISQTLGIPEGTVTSRLNRARSKLRRQLEGWYFDEEL